MRSIVIPILLLFSQICFAQTPQLVKDIKPGSRGISIGEAIAFNGKLIFNLDTSNKTDHNQLWISDGTDAGTYMLNAFKTGTDVRGFTELNGKLYFAANDDVHGYELWVTDGTVAGTQMVVDINTNAATNGIYIATEMRLFTLMNDKLYFLADDGTHGIEMWASDGSAAGTHMLKDINPSGNIVNTSFPSTYNKRYTIATVNNLLYFHADINDIDEVWVTDGTSTGTKMIPICPSPDTSSSPDTYMPFNNHLIFFAFRDTGNYGLWNNDGTTTGTTLLKKYIVPLGGEYTMVDNELFFITAKDELLTDYELCKTDGTAAGTITVSDSMGIGQWWLKNNNSKNGGLTSLQNKLYYLSKSSLWQSDGTPTGTIRLSNNADHASQLITANNRLYFRAFSTVSGQKNTQVFISDGTAAGTQPILYTGDNFDGKFQINLLNYSPLTQVGNTLFYVNGYDAGVGTELYKIDIPTAVNEIKTTENKIKISPNPATTRVQITVNNKQLDHNDTYTVLDITGKKLLSGQIKSQQQSIDIYNLASGVYFIQLNGVYAGKFVKE